MGQVCEGFDLGGGHLHQPRTRLVRFVRQLVQDVPHPHVEYRPVETCFPAPALCRHVPDPQLLGGDEPVPKHPQSGELVLKVVPLARDLPVQPGYLPLGALPVGAETLSAGKPALQAFEPVAGCLEKAGVSTRVPSESVATASTPRSMPIASLPAARTGWQRTVRVAYRPWAVRVSTTWRGLPHCRSLPLALIALRLDRCSTRACRSPPPRTSTRHCRGSRSPQSSCGFCSGGSRAYRPA